MKNFKSYKLQKRNEYTVNNDETQFNNYFKEQGETL